MTDRNDLVQAIHRAQDGTTLAQAVAALDNHDRMQREAAAADRELDLGAQVVAQRLTPASLHEHHTAATDWLLESFEPAPDFRVAMIAEASAWYRGLSEAVKADPEEFAAQASGRARTAASAHGLQAPAAGQEFWRTAHYLRSTDAASGLPQIDQTIDPNNNPSPTPYPAEVFPTFGEEQDPYNHVETNAHGSGSASTQAPMLQQIQQNSGSGYGSGPERQLTHDTGFDTSNSYAEVPLGTPGQIPTAPAATDSQSGSAPTPMQGQTQDADGAQKLASIEGYSLPDPFGYRWVTGAEIMHPFHERCASAHWPDEPCGSNEHTASVAIGYSMNLDAARRVAQCERIGAQEGLRAYKSAGHLAALAAHHNRVTAAWSASERTLEDTAVLHGFMAVVRPVLADLAPVTACSSCSSGNCQNCTSKGCNCKACAGKHRHTAAVVTARDFSEAERSKLADSGDALPDGKLPIKSPQDLKNAEHLKGKVKGDSKSEVNAYMERKEHEFGKAASAGRAPTLAGRLDFNRQGAWYYDSGAEDSDSAQGSHSTGDRGILGSSGRPFADRMLAMAGKEVGGGLWAVHAGQEAGSGSPGGVQAYEGVRAGSQPGSGSSVPHSGDGLSGREAVLAPSVLQRGASRGEDSRAQHPGGRGAQPGTQSGRSVPGGARSASNRSVADGQGRSQAQVSRMQAPSGRGIPGAGPGTHLGASGLDQIQQTVDPDNNPAPQDDKLPEGVAFPIDPAFSAQWVTGPNGAAPKSGGNEHEAARGQLPNKAAEMFGHMDAMEGQVKHKDSFPFSVIQHGRYLRAWNQTRAGIDQRKGREPMRMQEYSDRTGRPDLYEHYLGHYSGNTPQDDIMRSKPHAGPIDPVFGSRAADDPENNRCSSCGHAPGCGCTHDCDSDPAVGGHEQHPSRTSSAHTADAWSQPRQTTDDIEPPYNSPETTPPMSQYNVDYEAGKKAGAADAAAGQRPAFADNSSTVSQYVKGYAEAYSGSPRPQGAQDVPYSLGGDSGQGANAGEAQKAFQVARASRTSAAFAPDSLMNDPEFRRGYLFASKWQPGQRLVTTGNAKFEAGMYAGVTDHPDIQMAWLTAHVKGGNPQLVRRADLHQSFTRKVAARRGLKATTAYLKTAGISTDLITDGPGTSPDPMGTTPLNGPGTPPPMGGLDNANAPGGPSPYQGAPPLPGGPVVPDDVMGKSQQQPQPSGPFTNTFSGSHPENADLAPVAPNAANQPGYSNTDAYRGDPGGDRVAKLAAFRSTVQANLARMGEQHG